MAGCGDVGKGRGWVGWEGGGETGRNVQAGWTLLALEAGGRAGPWPQEFILPAALEDHRWSGIRVTKVETEVVSSERP